MRWLAATLVVAMACSTHPPVNDLPADLVFVHASVVDVVNGTIASDRTVIIRGNRITELAPTARTRVPRATIVVDAAGGF